MYAVVWNHTIATVHTLIGADIKQKVLLEWVDRNIDDDLLVEEKVKEKMKQRIERRLSFGKPPFDDKSDTQSFLKRFLLEHDAIWLGSLLFKESR